MKRPLPIWVSGVLWTAPWWLGFLLFLAIPMGLSFYLSFCDYPLLQPPAFIGVENYENLAQDDVFHKVIINTLIYAVIAIPLGTIVAVLLAVLLNQRVPGQAIFRACIFVPTIVGPGESPWPKVGPPPGVGSQTGVALARVSHMKPPPS